MSRRPRPDACLKVCQRYLAKQTPICKPKRRLLGSTASRDREQEGKAEASERAATINAESKARKNDLSEARGRLDRNRQCQRVSCSLKHTISHGDKIFRNI